MTENSAHDHNPRGLTDEQRAARRKFIGGSDANVLMSGDADRILALWENKTGRRDDEDLSSVLPVQIGIVTEPLNRYWWHLNTGQAVTHYGEQRTHPEIPFMGCTLDGLTITPSGDTAIWDAKHVNAFAKIDDVIQRYMPQIHHNAAVCGLNHAVLSVFVGTLTYEWAEIETDAIYLMDLMERERGFWACVESDTPPGDMPAITAPAQPEKWRTVDMRDSNAWAQWAGEWLENKKPAARFKSAEKEIKALMDPDVGHAHGHGVECKRAKNGSLRIGAQK